MSASESSESNTKGILWSLGIITLIIIIGIAAIGWYWSIDPDPEYPLVKEAEQKARLAKKYNDGLPRGYAFTYALIHISETLLNKNGGYISNDVAPPGIILDNIKNWEFGALVMLRDGTSALRNHFARSQSQSGEDTDLAKAEPLFYFNNDSWIFPATEDEYKRGLKKLYSYWGRLGAKNIKKPGRFYSRADNLRQYLEIIIKRMGDISSRLSASASGYISLEGTDNPSLSDISASKETPWLEIDDIFYEARGASWALLYIFKAIKVEFSDVLAEKHAIETMDILIHQLENSLTPIYSPMVLNGPGFGVFANYSLTMANYIARANGAALDIRELLVRG
ncbi:MAG: DUF2333 family protein [Methylococcaceae bacterium]